jgi:hypothetical protein
MNGRRKLSMRASLYPEIKYFNNVPLRNYDRKYEDEISSGEMKLEI